MGGFKASLANEIEKLYKKKKAVAIVIISLAVIVIGQLAVVGIRSGLGLKGAGSTEFPILVLSVFVNTVLPLFTALVAIDIFTGEFSHNTMKIALARPADRLKLFSAKIAAAAFFIGVNLLIVMVLSTLTGLLFNSSQITASGFFKILLSYLISLFPAVTLALAIVFLANIFKSGITVFFASILLFLAFKILGFLFPQYSSLFLTSMLDWYNLWIADSIPMAKISREFLIQLGYAIMFFTAGYYLFDGKDL
ncbi:MAG: ABC transporter permease [Clostridiales bacterium]|jgi:ABC-2 type transport system permease protein|nr:ABC transporter permease [Eubacteriales bacterium]MDH7566061.1 ABC transporter permease [Clostridiales bacterium]